MNPQNLISCCFMSLYLYRLTISSQQETGLTARPMPACDFSERVTNESVDRTSPKTLRGDVILVVMVIRTVLFSVNLLGFKEIDY